MYIFRHALHIVILTETLTKHLSSVAQVSIIVYIVYMLW